MSAVSGLLSITNPSRASGLDEKGDLVGEYQESILVRNAKGMNVGSTLFGLMARLKGESADNSEFNWFERDPVRREVSQNGLQKANGDSTSTPSETVPSATGDAWVITLQETSAGGDAWQYLAAGHILRNARTGEYIKVVTTPTANTVSVIRAIHTTVMTGLTLVDNDTWTIVTLGKDEGALPVRASYEEPTVLTNFVQTFNSTVELTNAFKANKLRSDLAGPLKERRIQALERIGKDIEGAFLLGVKKRLTGTNGYEYYTGGLKDAIDRAGLTDNALDGLSGTGVTLSVFNTWLESFMTSGSDAKLAFCGPKAYSVVSNFANSASNGFRIMNQETVWGMNITTVNTPFGELNLAFHPLLKEIPTYTSWMFVVDLAHVVQKTMEPLFLEPNIQTPGQDSYKEQFRAKLGLKLRFANAFGYARNLQLLKPNA